MLDSIYIGMSGLMGYSRGLRVIANNTANINTPGFKGSSLQFGDLFYANGPASGAMTDAGVSQMGQGLTTYSTTFDFSQGDLRQSGNALDLAVDGQGLFTLKDEKGELRYTRDGEFKFDADGVLVSRATGDKVMARSGQGEMVEISLAALKNHPATPTSVVKFSGNLAVGGNDSNGTPQMGSHTLSSVMVRDRLGNQHALKIEFNQVATPIPDQVKWTVTVTDGSILVATDELTFTNKVVDADTAKLEIQYHPDGQSAIPMTLDFSVGVALAEANSTDTLAASSIDGYGSGSLTDASFDADGILNLKYSNGQTKKDVSLALARFSSIDDVRAAGDNLFEAVDRTSWETGVAGTGGFGAIQSGVVEVSNVDLSSEFSDLVIMQRGYQASSQVVSTANEMLQELFSLKGR